MDAHWGTSATPGTSETRIEIPGHAMHEKGLQRQIAVGTLFNSQQRRALAVPRLNRWSTAGQPLVLFRHRFTWDFLSSCLRRDVQNCCLRYPGGLEGRLPSGPTEMSAPWFAQLRPAPPSPVRCADPTRPLCVRVLDSTGLRANTPVPLMRPKCRGIIMLQPCFEPTRAYKLSFQLPTTCLPHNNISIYNNNHHNHYNNKHKKVLIMIYIYIYDNDNKHITTITQPKG